MEIPRHWRLKAQRYRLEGAVCPTCRQPIFPPRPVCPYCMTQLSRLVGWRLEADPESLSIAENESHLRFRITERMIG